MKTYSAKPTDVKREWYVVDASEAPLGRLSTQVAALLTGKGKPMFTKHIDCGDYVIVINADKLVTTGDKTNKKVYYRHSGFPGGLKERTLAEQMTIDSTDVIRHAVRGMLPVNKLRDARLDRLKVYAGAEHQHEAQKPTQISVKAGLTAQPLKSSRSITSTPMEEK
ncbi:MAG TPA: 50S ribosomal protein L13 [Candidatus Saccharimonadales bacterium]|nr:50S ribosomal protein L13 [Candidatus Saccharimonadales bacterium]